MKAEHSAGKTWKLSGRPRPCSHVILASINESNIMQAKKENLTGARWQLKAEHSPGKTRKYWSLRSLSRRPGQCSHVILVSINESKILRVQNKNLTVARWQLTAEHSPGKTWKDRSVRSSSRRPGRCSYVILASINESEITQAKKERLARARQWLKAEH